MKKQKKILLIAVLATVALIGIVYAAFTVLTLKINTTASASASIFSVGFDDVAPVIEEKTNEDIIVNATTPTEGDKEITLSVSGLKAPGDKAEVTYTIINNGDIDASDIAIRLGPAITGTADWPEDFTSPGSEWTSEDGVFKFAAYCNYNPDYSGEDYWSLNSSGSAPLGVGIKGTIRVHVELLQRVDVDTDGSCTMKLIAMPDGSDIGNV